MKSTQSEETQETNSTSYILNQSSSSTNLELNLMPFSINHHGESKISTYFLSNLIENKHYESNFRGRYLHGINLDLPIHYYGTLMMTNHSNPTFNSNQEILVKSDLIKVGRPSRSTGINQSKRFHKKTKLETKSILHYELEVKEEENEGLIETNDHQRFNSIQSSILNTNTFDLIGEFNHLIIWNPDGPLDLKENYLINGLNQLISLSDLIQTASDGL